MRIFNLSANNQMAFNSSKNNEVKTRRPIDKQQNPEIIKVRQSNRIDFDRMELEAQTFGDNPLTELINSFINDVSSSNRRIYDKCNLDIMA